jgi:hypothetical protein
MRDSDTEPFVCSPTCRWFAYRTTCSEVEAQPIAARLVFSVMVERWSVERVAGACVATTRAGNPCTTCTCHTSETHC